MDLRRLSVGDVGDDVARLHQKLKSHGFEVSPDEAKRKFFGPVTREAVRECQKRNGLEVTCEVDEPTRSALSADAPRIPVPAAVAERVPGEPRDGASGPGPGEVAAAPPSEFERHLHAAEPQLAGADASAGADAAAPRERLDQLELL